MDTQALMDLCTINENVPDHKFYLGSWRHSCGTTACLVGNFCLARPEDRLELLDECGVYVVRMQGVPESANLCRYPAARFGITLREAMFLFDPLDPDRDSWGRVIGRTSRSYLGRDAAIRRVRKLLFYKLHKRELCYDENGFVRETIRRAEGNHDVMRHVLESVSSAQKTTELCHA